MTRASSPTPPKSLRTRGAIPDESPLAGMAARDRAPAGLGSAVTPPQPVGCRPPAPGRSRGPGAPRAQPLLDLRTKKQKCTSNSAHGSHWPVSCPRKPGAVHRAAPHPIQSGRDYPCPLGPVDNSATQERPRFETKQISMPADLRLITRTCPAGIERRAAPPHAGLSRGLDRDPRPGAQVLIPGTWGKGLPGKRHLYRGS